ncbi:MAG: FAD-dependent oxidoreductase [Mycobacteriales bacterium]
MSEDPGASPEIDLCVLGAGPAGLAAAWYAARAGRSVVVLERAPSVGGMAASFAVAGIRVDHGSHRLHPATPPDVLSVVRSLLGDDLQLRPRHGRLRLGGGWVHFPLRAAQLATALPARTIAGIAVDSVRAPMRRPAADTYAEVLRAGLGPTLYGALYEPFARKLWGLDPNLISGEQARRRVTADTPWKVAARVLKGSRGSGRGQVFYYPRRGFGQIAEAFASAALDAGARIDLASTVASVDLSGSLAEVRTDSGSVSARRVFSTIPLTSLATLTTPAVPTEVATAAALLRFRAMVLVYLVHDGGRWTEYDAHYLPGADTPVTRISEPANYRESADDPLDRSVICAEIPCAVGDSTWLADEDALAAIITGAIESNDLPPLRVSTVVVRRLPHVYPVYAVGYEAAYETLSSWADSLRLLTSFGRLGLFVHDNTHHAIAMARDAVSCLGAQGSWDAAAWAEARTRFASHVVED